MNDEFETFRPDNGKWIVVAAVIGVVLFGLAIGVRSLPLADDFSAFAAVAILLAGFAATAFLWSWTPRVAPPPARGPRQFGRRASDATLASH